MEKHEAEAGVSDAFGVPEVLAESKGLFEELLTGCPLRAENVRIAEFEEKTRMAALVAKGGNTWKITLDQGNNVIELRSIVVQARQL